GMSVRSLVPLNFHYVELVLFAPDALESSQQIVGVENRETTGSLRQSCKNLLVGGCRRRKLRHDAARLAIGRVVEIGVRHSAASASASCAATTRATTRASAGPASLTSSSASAGAASTTLAPSAGATGTATGASRTTTASGPTTATTAGAATTRPLGIRHSRRRISREQNPGPRCGPPSGPSRGSGSRPGLPRSRPVQGAPNRRGRKQAARVHGIDRYIRFIAGVDGRRQLGLVFRCQRETAGEQNHHFTSRYTAPILCQAAHGQQHAARAKLRRSIPK